MHIDVTEKSCGILIKLFLGRKKLGKRIGRFFSGTEDDNFVGRNRPDRSRPKFISPAPVENLTPGRAGIVRADPREAGGRPVGDYKFAETEFFIFRQATQGASAS